MLSDTTQKFHHKKFLHIIPAVEFNGNSEEKCFLCLSFAASQTAVYNSVGIAKRESVCLCTSEHI